MLWYKQGIAYTLRLSWNDSRKDGRLCGIGLKSVRRTAIWKRADTPRIGVLENLQGMEVRLLRLPQKVTITMKPSDIHIKKVHPDCPFTKEQMDDFRAMLYAVASANNLVAYPSWYMGYQNRQIRMIGRR